MPRRDHSARDTSEADSSQDSSYLDRSSGYRHCHHDSSHRCDDFLCDSFLQVMGAQMLSMDRHEDLVGKVLQALLPHREEQRDAEGMADAVVVVVLLNAVMGALCHVAGI